MTDDKIMGDIPQVQMTPETRQQLAEDPELDKAVKDLTSVMRDAMQGVKDGRYKSFDDAMEAMTGRRPTKVEPPHPPKYGYFLSVRRDPQGDGWMAVISDGHPQHGHPECEILNVERFQSQEEAKTWFEKQCQLLPWRGVENGE